MQIKNKLMAILLTVALLVSVLVLPVFQTTATDEETLDIWDGTQVAPQKEGGVFAIYTPEELAWYIAKNGLDSYGARTSAKLMNDIWLNDMIVTVKDGVATATKATDTSVVIDLTDHENNGLNQWFVDRAEGWFVGGTLDGQNHVVHGFYVKENYAETGGKPTSFAIGLIPRLGAETTVKNLGIENAYIDSTIGRIAAFIVGEANHAPAYISNCYTGASTFHKNTDKAAAISGGGSAASVVTDCYSLTTLDRQNNDCGAIHCDSWGAATITGCYSIDHEPKRSSDKGSNNYKVTSVPGRDANKLYPNLSGAFIETDEYPVLRSFAEPTNIWGGFASAPTKGTGTEADPWLIETPEHFAKMIKSAGNFDAANDYEYFKLTNDIYLNDMQVYADWVKNVTVTSGGKEVDPAEFPFNEWYHGDTYKKFVGCFDGDGHAVHGLFYNQPISNTPTTTIAASDTVTTEEEAKAALLEKYPDARFTNTNVKSTAGYGLFPGMVNGTVKNLAVKNSYMQTDSAYGAAALIGNYGNSSAIMNVDCCYVDKSVFHAGDDVSAIYGGGGGGNFAINVTNTYSLAALKSNEYIETITENKDNDGNTTGWTFTSAKSGYEFSFTGDIWSAGADDTFKNCYDGRGNQMIRNGNATNCYYTPAKGYSAVYAMPNLNADGKYYVTPEGPKLLVFSDLTESNWDEYYTTEFAGGDGTPEAPYQISTAAQLAAMVGMGSKGYSFELVNDIYVNDLDAVDWATGAVNEGYEKPLSWFGDYTAAGNYYVSSKDAKDAFTGSLDGNGYAIHGIYYEPYNGNGNRNDVFYHTAAGLFPAMTNATVNDLVIEDSFFCSGRFSGAVSAYAKNSNVSNVFVDDSVYVTIQNSGISIGYVYKNKVSTFESNAIGGVIGYAVTKFVGTNVGSAANIFGDAGHYGGIVATHYNTNTTLENCFSTGYAPIYSGSGQWGHGPNRVITVTNCYSDTAPAAWQTAYGTVTGTITVLDDITGPEALDAMSELSSDTWYAVNKEGKTPLLKVRGDILADVNCDGEFEKLSDCCALRVAIIHGEAADFGDRNKDTLVDILDLVTLAK